MLSNTSRLDFFYLKVIHNLDPPYHSKIIGHILKNKKKNKCVCIHEIIRLIIMKMKIEIKNKSHRHKMNRHRPRHRHRYSKCKKCLSMMMLICIRHKCTICIRQHRNVLEVFEAQSMKNLSNTEATIIHRIFETNSSFDAK